MKQILLRLLVCPAISILVCCNGKSGEHNYITSDSTSLTEQIDSSDVLANRVLTAKEQQALTPDQVIQILKDGNSDFVEDRLTVRNTSARVRAAANSQFPKAVILSCLDSRIPVEDVFHRGIGDIFVARVAGNIVNEDIVGSLEYGCAVSGAKLIVVLGHQHCGAIKSAIDNVKLGNISTLLAKIKPAIAANKNFKSVDSKSAAFVQAVCEENVRQSLARIRETSPILAAMENEKQIKIVGAIYNMATGKVQFSE
jgi:carbonic anhydrase